MHVATDRRQRPERGGCKIESTTTQDKVYAVCAILLFIGVMWYACTVQRPESAIGMFIGIAIAVFLIARGQRGGGL